MESTVSFVRMEDGTREDYQLLEGFYRQHSVKLPDELLAMVKRLGEDGKMGYKIDRYQHSLQTATRAERDGADEEMIVVALLHDIGDIISPENHSDLAAAVLQPYVSKDNHWLVRHHGIFQGYFFFHHYDLNRNERERYRGHPMFETTAAFCEKWDQTAFDPEYDTAPLEHFEPMVRRILARKPWEFAV
ncbi:MAG: HD domain-containing protein [Dongiaceae bacterium]|jgi:predicted HD phosphohydrolase